MSARLGSSMEFWRRSKQRTKSWRARAAAVVARFFARRWTAWCKLLGVAGLWSEVPLGGPVPRLKGGHEVLEKLYILEEKIGEGTFGKVYTCRCSGSWTWCHEQEPLCVKVVPVNGRHPSRIARMPEEEQKELLRLLMSLRHPNMVRYHRFVRTADSLCAVMSRCGGPDLSNHVETNGGVLLETSVRDLARQILNALGAIHAARLMHRDVKPDNFRFSDKSLQTLKLLDFGFAKKDDGDRPTRHTITGTLLYVAPEVFDEVYTLSCDMWSAGAVLFFMLSGELPFQTGDVLILRSMHRDPVLNGSCLFRSQHWKKVPEACKDLVHGLLTVDPTLRLTAAAALGHKWFDSEPQDESGTLPTLLKRCSRSLGELRQASARSLVELKRSTKFDWNMVEAARTSGAGVASTVGLDVEDSSDGED